MTRTMVLSLTCASIVSLSVNAYVGVTGMSDEKQPPSMAQGELSLEKQGETYEMCVSILRTVVGLDGVVISDTFTLNDEWGPTFRAQVRQGSEDIAFVCWMTNGEYEFFFGQAVAQ